MVAAADFFALRNQYRGRCDFTDAKAMYHAYETELYRFDQLYRHFCETADLAEAEGWGLLKPLRQELEACYGTWFVTATALTWGKFVDPAHGQSLLKNWRIEKVPSQQEFYARCVQPRLDKAAGRKVYVIISDAFRYEAAQELTRELNGKYRFEADLTSQLSVLPSYTALGMASLLPHQALAYKPTGEVLVDGKPASSLELRNEILAAVEGVAIKGEDLLAMSRDAGRELVREKMVIYVYHNTVDATGDYAPTEGKTFEAVRNLGSKEIEVSSLFVRKYEKLLAGGIWCILTLHYFYEEGQKSSPFVIEDLKPIQMPNMDMEAFFTGRKGFTEDEWLDVLLRSTGMEPTNFDKRVKWHLLARMIPLVENNYNLCELGPRGTGKSHIYKEISPNSILISGGQTTVANLFYNMSSRRVGLVGLWDVVAFDEVAGISFKDKDGVQIMKDYMASGSFARGKDAVNAYASMVFVGNINQPVDTLVKTSHLLAPFPDTMIDTAFFDRFHAYVPGWEIPKMRPEYFTNQYGMIVDYLAEFMREMRKRTYADAINKFFKLGRDLNQRDSIAVKRTVSGLLKLLYPNEEYDKEAVRRCLEYALEVRRRVKEQLKTIGGMEFYDVHFSYIDLETNEEKFISVPEQGGGSLISDGPMNPGVLHIVGTGSGGLLGLYRVETQVTPGNGGLKLSGFGSHGGAKEGVKVGFDYFRANASRVSASIKPGEHDYHFHVVELHNSGPTTSMTLATFVALCSALLGKPIQTQMVILGSMSLGGNLVPVENLAQSMQVAFDAGGKRILLPMASVSDIPTIPGELFAKFQTSFYADPVDAVFKAMGVQ